MRQLSKRSKTYMIASALFLMLLFVLPLIIPWDPLRTNTDEIWMAPNSQHWLGTDSVGRDVLARILLGGKISLAIAACVELLAFPVGAVLGFIGARTRLRAWAAVDRLMDVIFSFPTIILALFLAGVIGSGIPMVVLVITVVEIPVYYIFIKRLIKVLYSEDYVTECNILGIPERTIFINHIVPHMLPAVLPKIIINFATTILFESTMSILGIGVQAPLPSWGNMIRDGVKFMSTRAWLVISASTIFAITVLLLFGLGDSLSDRTAPSRK